MHIQRTDKLHKHVQIEPSSPTSALRIQDIVDVCFELPQQWQLGAGYF